MLHALLACVMFFVPAVAQEPTSTPWAFQYMEDAGMAHAVSESPRSSADAPRAVAMLILDGPSDRAGVSAELERIWSDRELGQDWVVACPVRMEVRFTTLVHVLVARFDSESTRVHLIGVGDGARRALRMAAEHPDLVASVTACAPSTDVDLDKGSLDALISTPLALLRGREDARDPSLAIVERMLALGRDDVSLDFAATTPHATPSASEGRVAQRLTEFRSVERARVAGERAVNARLDAFHAAASKADGASYFACLAPDAIFIGTDATERWSVAQFRAYCEPYFAQGKGWTYTPSERHVYLSRDRATVWFDERLSNAKYGELRGSGALRRDGERWLITQYVMSFPVPNDLSAELVKRIGERKR